jgi:hypothetical protein
MAHTNRRRTDKRKDGKVYPVGTRVGMVVNSTLHKGRVYSVDEGGWVYIDWKYPRSGHLPGYCRSSQLMKLGEKDAA